MNLRLLLPFCIFVLFAAGPVSGQVPFAISEPGASPGEESREGIRVSGEWTIAIFEQDGTLVERRTFHNALEPSGASLLVNLMIGSASVGSDSWVVHITGDLGPCENNTTQGGLELGPSECLLLTPPAFAGISDYDFMFGGLVAEEHDESGDGLSDTIQLRGSFTSHFDDHIEIVSTSLFDCSSEWAPDDCPVSWNALGGTIFTSKTLDVPLDVEANQTVMVEVKIGFSSESDAALHSSPTERASID